MSDDICNPTPKKEQNTNNECQAPGSAQSSSDPRTARIQQLNDQLRQTGSGGKVMITNGISGLEPATADRVLEAVRQFDAFCPDNDPWSEHDCASLTADGTQIIWKIDYFERSGRIHSPDPADPKVTLRVLTIMLANEY